ncbi:hypothetical protein WH47_02192 [Habropoda laboriosa]|uniref:Uncharacterized protein n=1 Tax=Habropoda laboriosa TaxID=597456 RepID=A0A0L7QZ89_9HYME|nr:hypothetical protein WH47_02192 [Habropoda laboriosa]
MDIFFQVSLLVLLASHAMADIMLQPGYGHPHPGFKISNEPRHPIVQPHETFPHSEHEDIYQQQQATDPGYHLELHPVYTDAYHVPAHALSPYLQLHHLLPPTSELAHAQLKGGHEIPGINGIPPNYYNPHLPLPVHNRYRRSNSDERDVATQGDRHNQDDVATKPSLVNEELPVVDLQSQNKNIDGNLNEKSVSIRQSGTLLGLNPSRMYLEYQQYRSAEMDPKLSPNQEIANQQTLSQINTRAATKEQAPEQPQAVVYTQTLAPQVYTEYIQRSPPRQLQQQEIGTDRNFPDPRPISTTPSSIDASKNDQSQTSMGGKHAETGDNEESVGSKFGDSTKVNVAKHLHQHETSKGRSYASGESSASTNPSYVVYNVGTPNNLATASTTGVQQQQLVQVYQLPAGQETNYSPIVHQISLSSIYPGNYLGNYVASYQNSPASASSPITICLQTPNNVPSVAYQLV